MASFHQQLARGELAHTSEKTALPPGRSILHTSCIMNLFPSAGRRFKTQLLRMQSTESLSIGRGSGPESEACTKATLGGFKPCFEAFRLARDIMSWNDSQDDRAFESKPDGLETYQYQSPFPIARLWTRRGRYQHHHHSQGPERPLPVSICWVIRAFGVGRTMPTSLRLADATGLPQLSPRLDPSGMVSRSSFV